MAQGSSAVRGIAVKRYWREADARVVVDAWRASGAPLVSFCRRHRVKPERVARWARRLQQEQEVQFHPVELVSEGPVPGVGALEVELARGATVRLPAGFALEDLRRVLLALDERAGC